MMLPQNLVIMSALLPTFAAFVLIIGRLCLPREQRGFAVAWFASIGTCACALAAIIQVQFDLSESPPLPEIFQIPLLANQSLKLNQDRLSLFWLMLNSTIASQILLFSRKGETKDSQSRLNLSLFVLLLAVSQWFVLMGLGKVQWMLLGLSHWLLFGLVASQAALDKHPVFPRMTLLTLTVADLFWMLGLIGIQFVTGTLDISTLCEPHTFLLLGEAETALMTTSAMSCIVSLVIRLGLFPAITWSNDLLRFPRELSCYLLFSTGLGGYLLFRWLPVLSLWSEPRTILIGITGLSAVVLAVSALLQSGLKQLQRLLGVPLALVAMGIAVDPVLWPQMAALFSGSLIFGITLTLGQQHPEPTCSQRKLWRVASWSMIGLLLFGSFGIEALIRATQAGIGKSNNVQIPSVMLPLLVLALGLFLFGLHRYITQESSSQSLPSPQREQSGTGRSNLRSLNMAMGLCLLLSVSVFPFFVRPASAFQFLPPLIVGTVSLLTLLVTRSGSSIFEAETPELGSLVKMCRQDFYIETIIDRGLTIPLEVAAALLRLFDQFVLQGIAKRFPEWVQSEVSETCNLLEMTEHRRLHTVFILLGTFVLILVVVLGK